MFCVCVRERERERKKERKRTEPARNPSIDRKILPV